jgi:hypothetical protein
MTARDTVTGIIRIHTRLPEAYYVLHSILEKYWNRINWPNVNLLLIRYVLRSSQMLASSVNMLASLTEIACPSKKKGPSSDKYISINYFYSSSY